HPRSCRAGFGFWAGRHRGRYWLSTLETLTRSPPHAEPAPCQGTSLAPLGRMRFRYPGVAVLLSILVFEPPEASAYSVLSHEATVDALWTSGIRPLLLRRYPRSSAAELQQARAYAYGGSVIQDLGYYPFGSR